MTGKYIDFKGRLKVGDRVRLDGTHERTITGIHNYGFSFLGYDGLEKLLRWDGEGTLKLLSPSPRVVALETLEPGDRIRYENGNISEVVDSSKNGKIVWLEGDWMPDHVFAPVPARVSMLKDIGVQPVQPASPPAPAEKEWWKEWMSERGLSLRGWVGEDRTETLREIVAEAERRGAEEAWKEAKDVIRDRVFQMDCGSAEEHQMNLFSKINAKIESLSKPVTNGEK